MSVLELIEFALVVLAVSLLVELDTYAQKPDGDDIDAIRKLIEKRDYMSWINKTCESTDKSLKMGMSNKLGISYCRAGMIDESCKIIDNLDQYPDQERPIAINLMAIDVIKALAKTSGYRKAVEYTNKIITDDRDKADLLAELVCHIYPQDKDMALNILKDNKSISKDVSIFRLIELCSHDDKINDANELFKLLEDKQTITVCEAVIRTFNKLRENRDSPKIPGIIESLNSGDNIHTEAAGYFLINCGKAGKDDVVKCLIDKKGEMFHAVGLTDAANVMLDRNDKSGVKIILKEFKRRADDEKNYDVYEHLFNITKVVELEYKLQNIEDAKKSVDIMIKAYDRTITINGRLKIEGQRAPDDSSIKSVMQMMCSLGKENEAIERIGKYGWLNRSDEILLAEELSASKKNEALLELWKKLKDVHGSGDMYLYYIGVANGIAREKASHARINSTQSKPANDNK